MPGAKPVFRVKCRRKQPAGAQQMEMGAAWAKDKGFGYSFKLPNGAILKLADGTKITNEEFWIDLYDDRPSDQNQKTGAVRPRASATIAPAPAAPAEPTPEYDPAADDIPF